MNSQNETVKIPGGFAEVAQYKPHSLAQYRGNPLIEALPPILPKELFVNLVTQYPAFNSDERGLNPEERLHLIAQLTDYFQPLDQHINLEQKFSRIIRQGYRARNPLGAQYAARLRQVYRAIKDGIGITQPSFSQVVNVGSSASGFTLIGVSGVGKSTAVGRILNLYPQVISHSNYEGTDLNLYQIVWLKLDCPHQGSLKGLCTDFFQAVDKLLGSDHSRKFGSRQTSEDTMLAQMAQIASTHCLGVLVIDEIQNLSRIKSGGSEKILNFFVKLVNIIGVPIVRIGTNKARSILQGDFRQARRGVGEGGLYWDRMKRDNPRKLADWEFFIEGLFEHQWTKQQAELDEEFEQILYEESQGIADIVVKLFMMAQWRAVALEKELITPRLIKQVATDDSLELVRPMLEALKSNDQALIEQYGDIDPFDVTSFYNDCLSQINQRKLVRLEKLRAEQQTIHHDPPELVKKIILALLDLDVNAPLAQWCAKKVYKAETENADLSRLVNEAYKLALSASLPLGAIPSSPNDIQGKKQKSVSKGAFLGDLRKIVDEAKKKGANVQESLEIVGIIKIPANDFIRVG